MRAVLSFVVSVAILVVLGIDSTVSAGNSYETPGGFGCDSLGDIPQPVIRKCSPEVRAKLDSLIVLHDRCFRGEAPPDSVWVYGYQAYMLSSNECGVDSPECVEAFIRLIWDTPDSDLNDILKTLTFGFNPWGPYVGYAYYELATAAERAGDYALAANAFGGAANSDLPDRMKIISRFKRLLYGDRKTGILLRGEWDGILEDIREQPDPVARWLWFEINLQLALHYYDNGNFDEALNRIRIAEGYMGDVSTLQECKLLRAKYKSLLASDSYAAERCLDREIEILSSRRKRVSPDRLKVNYDEQVTLAEALMLRGDFEISEHMNHKAGLDYYSKSLKALKTPYFRLTQPHSQVFCKLMDLMRELGQTEPVIPEAEKYIALCKAHHDTDKFKRAALSLAECYLVSGRLTEARNLLDSVASDIDDSDICFYNFALLKSRLDLLDGKFDDAAVRLESLADCARSFEERLKAVRNLVVVYLASNDRKFGESVDRLCDITKENAISHIMQISPKQRRNWLLTCRRTINNLSTFSGYSDMPVARLADLNLFMKGMLFRTSSEIRGMLENHEDTRKRLESLRAKRIMLNNAIAVGDTVRSKALSSEVDEEERELVSGLASIRELSEAVDRSVADVRKKISGSSLVVDFVKDSGKAVSVYGALVYSRSMDPVYVRLFEDDGKVTSDIGKTIWEKIYPYAEGYTDIYFSAEGLLHRFPIEFAPYGADNLPICFQKRMHRVFHLADIADDCPVGTKILAVGVSDHNSPVADTERADKGNWTDLSGVDAEMDAIASHFGSRRVTMLHNDAATEGRFKAIDGRGVNVLHISTHGVFRNHDALIKAYNDPNDFDHNMACRVINGGLENLSGLVLRRGNLSWKNADIDTDEDDILTAEEIETMSFPDLRLTVLSACDTGLGDTDAEGVWGLQRAFRVAGSEFMICALNKVDQYWAAMFMDIFYDNASGGKSIYDSFSATVRELYQMNPDMPEVWSSFILIE